MVAALAALAWLMTSFGCTSATIEEQDTDPRFEIVDGRGDYEWEPDTGWVLPEGGAWGASDTARRESGEALQAEAYAELKKAKESEIAAGKEQVKYLTAIVEYILDTRSLWIFFLSDLV